MPTAWTHTTPVDHLLNIIANHTDRSVLQILATKSTRASTREAAAARLAELDATTH